jgi:hypothetical protein
MYLTQAVPKQKLAIALYLGCEFVSLLGIVSLGIYSKIMSLHLWFTCLTHCVTALFPLQVKLSGIRQSYNKVGHIRTLWHLKD